MIMEKVRQFVLICLILTPAYSYSGTESGGGGHVVFDQSLKGYILADLKQIDKNFTDTDRFLEFTSSRLVDEISNLSFENKASLNEQSQNFESPFAFAIYILNQWSRLTNDLISKHIRAAILNPVRWNFISAKIDTSVHFQSSSTYNPHTHYTTAAYYLHDKVDYKVQVSIPVWNQTKLFSQSGIIIHEALRHIQIGRMENFDEDSLQKATSIITLCKPNIILSQFAYFLMINALDEAENNMGSFESVTAKFCKPIYSDLYEKK